MNTYYCKCGLKQDVSASGATTALKDPDRLYPNQLRAYGETGDLTCTGCPYICQRRSWKDGKAVVTYEARMSKRSPILHTGAGKYTLTDNTVGKIYTLDMDFARRIKEAEKEIDGLMPDRSWDNPMYQVSQYHDDGRLTLTINPEGGKRGIAAKKQLFEMFFTPYGRRKDLTPEEEKEKILRTIVEARRQAQGKGNECMSYKSEDTYRSPDGKWYRIHWDEGTKAYCIQQSADGATWTPCNSSFYPHFPEAHATFEAIVRNLGLVPEVKWEEAQCDSEEAAEDDSASGIVGEAVELSPVDVPGAALIRPDAEPVSLAPEFDYTGLPEQTVAVMRMAEDEIRDSRKQFVVRVSAAVAAVHEAVVANCDDSNAKHGNRGESTFLSWCNYAGFKKDAAYRLLQVNALLSGAAPEEQLVLEAAQTSLLYAAAKPSAPPELVERVKSGDITTHKEYQAEMQKLRDEKEAERRRADRAEAERDEADRVKRQAEAEMANYQSAVNKANRQMEVMSEQHAKAVTENTRLKKELKEREEAHAAALDNRAELAIANRKLAEAEAAIAAQQDEIARLNARPMEVAVDLEATERRAQEIAAQRRIEAEMLTDAEQADVFFALKTMAESARNTFDLLADKYSRLDDDLRNQAQMAVLPHLKDIINRM